MRKILLVMLAVAVVAFAQETTPNLGLKIPTPGTRENTWGPLMTANLSKIDGYLSGSLSLPPVFVRSQGVFTNTQNNLNTKFIVNGLDTLNMFQNGVQGGNTSAFTTDAFTAGIHVPAGANVLQANAVSGYAQTDSSDTYAVAGYFPCWATSAGGYCWGVNSWAGDAPGLSKVTNMHSIEADINFSNTGDVGYGVVSQGFWTARPGLAQAFLAQRPSGPGAGFGWSSAFATSPSASLVAFLAAPSLLAGPANSQFLVFESYKPDNSLSTGNLYLDPTGAMIFAPGVIDAPFAVDTIKPKGGSPPTCTFTSGGGTSPPSCRLTEGSSNSAGTIIAITGTGSPAGTGTITLTFHGGNPIGVFPVSCIYTASDADVGQWQLLAVIKDKMPTTSSDLFTWTNGTLPTALSTSTPYRINYHCWGQ